MSLGKPNDSQGLERFRYLVKEIKHLEIKRASLFNNKNHSSDGEYYQKLISIDSLE